MKKLIGIDLGTTNSAVSYLDEMGTPTMIYNDDGENVTPSVVYFSSSTHSIIGKEAKKELDSKETFSFFKRQMGLNKKYNLFDKEITPVVLSSLVLKKLYQDAQNKLNNPLEAVVTVPANFTNEAREQTLEAGRLAELDIKYIINEPTASALYYAYKSGQELSGHYAVYDLGGGTFDISIIKASGKDIEVLSSEGVPHLGGKDFDDKLRELVSKKFKEQTGNELHKDEYNYGDAEEDKKSLSKRDEINISLGRGANRVQICIRRDEFETAISSLVTQTEMLCESAIDEVKLTAHDIREIFLVGGSTRIPFVKKSVEKVFDKKPLLTHNPDEVVSLGASIYCGYKTTQQNLNPIQKACMDKINIQEITNHFFGTIILDEEMEQIALRNDTLIKKGEKIPCSKSRVYHTVRDNQSEINCKITQSGRDETDPKFVNIIWEGDLDIPSGRPAGQEIRVTFSYDENQIIKCSFLDINSGREKSVDLNMDKKNKVEKKGIEKFLVD